jgi:chromosome partitioning protein
MRITAIVNQKGGCGKTTIAINLAAVLGANGARVLLVDMDPQGHASLGLGKPTTDLPGLYEVFAGERDLASVIQPGAAPGVDLVPATISLTAAEHILGSAVERDGQLSQHLRTVDGRYDEVILDCPPALGLLSVNALRAADQVLVPVDASLFALDGLERLRETLGLLESRYGRRPPLRLVANMFDTRTRFAREIFDSLATLPSLERCETRVRNSIRVREAAYRGQPLAAHAPRAPVTEDFRGLAAEIAGRSAAAGDARRGSPTRAATESTASLHEVVLDLDGLRGRDVRVAGEFNGWVPDGGVETLRDGATLRKVLRLRPGAYEYRLVVDGVWQQDPTNPQAVPNHLGGSNSLLRV